MDKQSSAAFILIGVILVIWLYFNAPAPNPNLQKNKADSTVVENKEVEKPQTASEPEVNEPNEVNIDSSLATNNTPEKIITVETDLAKIELTNKGGKLKKYYLKEFETWYYKDEEILSKLDGGNNFYNTHVQLINQKDNGDFNIRFVTKNGKLINTSKVDFETSATSDYLKVEKDDSLRIDYIFKLSENKYLKKSYLFRGNDYQSKVDIELVNLDDVISSYRYDIEWSNGINFVEENSVDEANFSNASAFSGGEQVIVDASSHGEKVSKEINGIIDWIGVRNKYFGIIISPTKPIDAGANLEGYNQPHPKWGEREYYSISLKVPFNNDKYQKNSFDLYIGPLDYDILKSYNKHYEAIYDFGSFFGLKIITRPISEYLLLPLFRFLHNFIPNYGVLIILFSLIIKIVLYPFTGKSYQSMKKMSLLQPKMKEIKEKYKDDPQRVQKETMKLYSTYGINPMGGCLPMLLQMPILFALFTFFNVAIDIRHEPFVWWITNLSSPDVIYTLPFKLPIVGIDKISGLALLLGITMFIQQKMTTKDPSQKAMVYIMPVMLTFMFMGFSSGLNLYYFMFNLFSIIQQQWINKKGDAELVPVKNPKKKGGFMQKMMEAAEQKQREQQQIAKKSKKNKRKF